LPKEALRRHLKKWETRRGKAYDVRRKTGINSSAKSGVTKGMYASGIRKIEKRRKGTPKNRPYVAGEKVGSTS